MLKWLNQLLAGKSSPPAAQTPSVASPPLGAIPTAPAHLALLARFQHAADPDEVALPYWDTVLPQPVATTLAAFRRQGWLVDAPWQAVFASRHRVDELKPLLRERGLKVSGKKDELVARLLEADPAAMQARVAQVKAWTLSAEAAEAVARYVANDRAAKAQAHASALAALQAGQSRDAIAAIVGYERTRVFPRGLGIDWNSEGVEASLLPSTEAILQASPGILREVPPDELPALRVAAAMMHLTGENAARAWLPADLVGHPRLDLDTAARMVLFHGGHMAELRELRAHGIRRVEILGSDDSCPTCAALEGKKFTLDKAPELPHPGCTHDKGCRCLYQSIFNG